MNKQTTVVAALLLICGIIAGAGYLFHLGPFSEKDSDDDTSEVWNQTQSLEEVDKYTTEACELFTEDAAYYVGELTAYSFGYVNSGSDRADAIAKDIGVWVEDPSKENADKVMESCK